MLELWVDFCLSCFARATLKACSGVSGRLGGSGREQEEEQEEGGGRRESRQNECPTQEL